MLQDSMIVCGRGQDWRYIKANPSKTELGVRLITLCCY